MRRFKDHITEAPRRKGAPKMTGDFVAIQRAKDAEHAKAMGRSVKTGRKLPKKTMTSTQRSLAQIRGEEVEQITEASFSADVTSEPGPLRRYVNTALKKGLKTKVVRHGGATEVILTGDKEVITKFLKSQKFPAKEIERGFAKMAEAYRPPTAAEIKKDKERENAGKKRPSMDHKSISNKLYVNMRPKLKEEEIKEAIKAYCVEENISADDLADMNEEQLDEIIGKVVGGAVKMAAKGAYRAAVNKQGNFRLSSAGRADRAEKKAADIEKKNKDRERIRAAKDRLRAAKQKARQK